MSYKCNNCGYPYLSGKENDCPKCHLKITYRCNKCNKELLDGPPRLCPACEREKELESEKKKKKVFDVLKWISLIIALGYGPLPDFIPGPFDDAAVFVLFIISFVVFLIIANNEKKKINEIENNVVV